MRKINFVQPVIFGYQNKEEGGNFNEEFQLLYPAIAESIKNLIAGLTGTEVKNNYKSLVDFQTSNMFKQDFKVSLNIVEETFTSVVYSVTVHDIANKPCPMFSETKAAKVTNPSIGLPYFVGIEEKITKECVFTTEECVMLTNKLDALFDDYKSGKLRVVQTTAKEIKNDTVKDIKLEIQPPTVSKLAGNPNNFVIPTVKPYTSNYYVDNED